MSRSTLLPEDDRYLTAAQCAERLQTSVPRFRILARDSVHLRAGKVWRGRLCFWLQSSLVRYMHFESTRVPEERQAERFGKARRSA